MSNTGKTLERARGLAYDLIVTRKGGTITLWSEAGVRHTVYESGTPHLPGLEYARNMLAALAFCPEADSCLVLGLGGGSIPRMFVAARPTMDVKAVEIDPAVIDLAARHFHIHSLPRCEVFNEDAADFVMHCPSLFGIIIVDTYCDDRFPDRCLTCAFIENAASCLQKDGVMAVNWLSGYPELTRKMLHNMKSTFGAVWRLSGLTTRNVIYFASAGSVTRSGIVETAACIETKLPFAFSLKRLVRRLQLIE